MPLLVAVVHEVHEVLGRAVAAGDGVIADGLVAPRAVEGCSEIGINSMWVKPIYLT